MKWAVRQKEGVYQTPSFLVARPVTVVTAPHSNNESHRNASGELKRPVAFSLFGLSS